MARKKSQSFTVTFKNGTGRIRANGSVDARELLGALAFAQEFRDQVMERAKAVEPEPVSHGKDQGHA